MRGGGVLLRLFFSTPSSSVLRPTTLPLVLVLHGKFESFPIGLISLLVMLSVYLICKGLIKGPLY